MSITYRQELNLRADEYADLLVRSVDSGGIWPVRDLGRIERMIASAQILICARDEDGLLVGIWRALSDFAWCTYVSEMAVAKTHQNRGIASTLMEHGHRAAGSQTSVFWVAIPENAQWFRQRGYKEAKAAYVIPREK